MMPRFTPWLCALVFVAAGCNHDDTGQRCYPPADPNLPTQPIGGETPVLEVVAVQRSTDCDSFQCLSDRGYLPYCTKPCSYSGSSVGAACTSNADCTGSKHCFQGFCRDDDCPGGFVCSTVQDVGPLANQLFCVYKEGCGENRDCEALGDMDCVHLGCFDSTLLTNPPNPDDPHLLTCKQESADSYSCQCPSAGTCPDSDLVCIGPDSSPWPAGSVERRGVCMRHGVDR